MPKVRSRENSALEDVDMTKEEFEQIKDAFKKEEFRKMFANYVNEVNDPKNRAIYESEITQMEKDRGVDITFVHPVPGYVIKTSVDGKQKAFINICQNDNVGKPSSKPATQQGTSGADWSVPYIQAAPKIDLDKNRNRCLVYDVVFHPDTLFLARENNAFRKFVNDTALMAVEDNYNVKLDRRNLKFPKMKFKGAQQATVIRRKRTDMSDVKDPDELFDIPNYPYEPLAENPSPIVTKVKEEPTQTYTTPHYILNHRKEVDMHEFSYAPDAKMYAATPTELILKIDLPLIKSALDMNLDVCERSLLLVTEGTAKYKLEVKLPWPVDEDAGTAKFDKSTKQLHITLPVKRKPLGPAVDPSHEDSGVESDHNPPKSSSDEDTSDNTFPSESGVVVEETLRTSPFLDPDAHYSFPSYTLNPCERSLAAVLDTPKVDSTSLKYRLIPQGVHLCFVSLGSGFFPINYTFCIKVMGGEFNPGSLNVDISEDNVVVKLIVLCHDTLDACHFLIGPQPDSLTEKFTMFPSVVSAKCDAKPQTELHNLNLRQLDIIDKTDMSVSFALRKLELGENVEGRETRIDMGGTEETGTQQEQECSTFETINGEIANEEGSGCVHEKESNEIWPKETENARVRLTQGDDGATAADAQAVTEGEETRKATKDVKLKKRLSPKSRTHSESSSAEVSRRSILKCSRSLSESHADDYSVWSSVDSSDSCIPEEMSNEVKKSVRFSEIISHKYYRANSSILGQRKKNQRKLRNKKKAHDRRASESEASASEAESSEAPSDVSASDVSDISSEASSSDLEDCARPYHPAPIPSSKSHHRRRGQKNRRKNAATDKHNAASWSS